jgi:hypothetical protein
MTRPIFDHVLGKDRSSRDPWRRASQTEWYWGAEPISLLAHRRLRQGVIRLYSITITAALSTSDVVDDVPFTLAQKVDRLDQYVTGTVPQNLADSCKFCHPKILC